MQTFITGTAAKLLNKLLILLNYNLAKVYIPIYGCMLVNEEDQHRYS